MTARSLSEVTSEPRGAMSNAFLLAQVGAQAAIQFGERLAGLRLSRPDAGILRLVAQSPGLTQRELGRRLSIVPSRLVALLDELQQKGLIERRRDRQDRRSHALHLTPSGRNTSEQVGRIAREHDDALCAALSKDEKLQLNALLRRIAQGQKLIAGVHPGYRLMGRQQRRQ